MRLRYAVLGAVVLSAGLVVATQSPVWAGDRARGSFAEGPNASAGQLDGASGLGQVRADVQALRAAAHDQIRALLTPEQQTQFDALKPQGDRAGRFAGPRHGGGRGAGGPGLRPDFAGGREGGHGQVFLDHMSQRLNLTADQRTAVGTILEAAQTVHQTRQDQARTDFRALLTPEQVATLDQLKAEHGQRPFGKMGGCGHGPANADGGPLQLTADQKTQAKEVFSKLRTDMQQMRSDMRQQIDALLTDAQKALRPAQHANGGPRGGGQHRPGGWRGHPGMPDAGMMLKHLTQALNLTDAQQASVQSILESTRTAVQARIQEARASNDPLAVPAPAVQTDKITAPQGTDQ